MAPRRPRKVARADQPDDPVAQILALQKHEDDEDDDDAERGERADERPDECLQELQRARRGLMHLDGDRLPFRGCIGVGRLGCFLRVRIVDLAAEVLHHLGRPVEEASAGRRLAQRADLGLQIVLVGRQPLRQVADLQRDHACEGEKNHEGDDDHSQHGGDPGHAEAPQPADQRGEREAEKRGQRDRDENVAAEIEGGDDHEDHDRRGQPGSGRRPIEARAGLKLVTRPGHHHVATIRRSHPKNDRRCFGGKSTRRTQPETVGCFRPISSAGRLYDKRTRP